MWHQLADTLVTYPLHEELFAVGGWGSDYKEIHVTAVLCLHNVRN